MPVATPPDKPLINKTLRKHGEQPRRFVISTNAPAWALLMINADPEITLQGRLSASLPLYYSGFNYFRGDLKFRTFTLQPTLRVWLGKSSAHGWWVGPHLGVAWFDVAFGGSRRYQDTRPALGAGISAGWRRPMGSSGRWTLEVSLGAGVYSTKYDVFANHCNGPRLESRSRVWAGIDRVAVSIGRIFDLSPKKGGRR